MDANTNRPPLITEAYLDQEYQRVDAGLMALDDMFRSMPLVIEDDEDVSLVAEAVAKLQVAQKRAEELRVVEKEPYLDAGRTVDGWFNARKAKLNTWSAALATRLNAHVKRKAEAERKKREKEEAAAKEEHERQLRFAAEAASANRPVEAQEATNKAAEAWEQAQGAAAATQGRAADLVRQRTDGGQTVSAQEVWLATIEDYNLIDLNLIRDHLSSAAIEQAVNRAVKVGGLRQIPGVRIEKVTKAIVR